MYSVYTQKYKHTHTHTHTLYIYIYIINGHGDLCSNPERGF